MVTVGAFVTFGVLFGILMLFSFAKLQDQVIEIKRQVDLKNEETEKRINHLQEKLNQYDSLFQKVIIACECFFF